MQQFKKFLDSMEHYELVKLKQGIENSTIDIGKEIKNKIKELEKKHGSYCATCSSDIEPYSTYNYTLIFGPEDFRKKASFCGPDCIQYFLSKLKETEKGDVDRKTAELPGTGNE
ncbi:hypothetical protein J4212_03160 [Candidatus Woesearchaeota archaeon]|nr:hypothetical protein [Candidatus Woesearchaeota archaeon]